MKNYLIGLLMLPMFGLASCNKPVAEFDEKLVLAKSLIAANEYQDKLQTALGAALKTGGPLKAVDVCNQAAPEIAQQVSLSSGAEVKRIALKTRNPVATPNVIEKQHLTEWANAPLNDDKTPKSVIFKSDEDGKTYVNFMRAIPLKAQPCTTCHGVNVAPEIDAKIKSLYPEDNATGFKEGDLRGAILVKWPIDAVK